MRSLLYAAFLAVVAGVAICLPLLTSIGETAVIDQPGPTHTPKPTNTEKPTHTPKPTNTEKPTNTPKPTHTAKPTNTPQPVSVTEISAQCTAQMTFVGTITLSGPYTGSIVLVATSHQPGSSTWDQTGGTQALQFTNQSSSDIAVPVNTVSGATAYRVEIQSASPTVGGMNTKSEASSCAAVTTTPTGTGTATATPTWWAETPTATPTGPTETPIEAATPAPTEAAAIAFAVLYATSCPTIVALLLGPEAILTPAAGVIAAEAPPALAAPPGAVAGAGPAPPPGLAAGLVPAPPGAIATLEACLEALPRAGEGAGPTHTDSLLLLLSGLAVAASGYALKRWA